MKSFATKKGAFRIRIVRRPKMSRTISTVATRTSTTNKRTKTYFFFIIKEKRKKFMKIESQMKFGVSVSSRLGGRSLIWNSGRARKIEGATTQAKNYL